MSEFVMVRRELLDRLDNPHSYVRNLARDELRAVLAQEAGPGERKPDAIIEGVMTSAGITHAIYASTVSLKHGEQVKLCAEPLPHHPILKVLSDPQAMELVALKATVAQQAQLIEWMKKGHGEPVAWGADSDLATIKDGALWSGTLWGKKNPPMLEYRKPLYASPPAPVAVVTREQVEIVAESIYWQWAGREGFVPWVKGGNSLKQDEARSIAWSTLDKVKELNQ